MVATSDRGHLADSTHHSTTAHHSAQAAPHEVAVGLFRHYDATDEVKAYYGVLAVYALARAATEAGDDATVHHAETVVRRFPDEIPHPPYNFPSYRIGGIAHAFLSARGHLRDRADLLRHYADEMMTATRDEKGILAMPGRPDLIWIDVAMASAPFLMYAGQALNEPRYIEEAITQAVLMYDEFLDPDNGLLHQCKGFVAKGVLSQDHWGRGNGWGLFALAELLRGLPAEYERREEVVERFVALSRSLLPHQTGRGLWRQEISMADAWEESSGSGLIVYCLGVGIQQGVLVGQEWRDAVSAGVHGLARWCVNTDFSTENSCPGTLCPGEGEATGTPEAYVGLRAPFRDEPHGFAALILAMSVAHVVGIGSVRLRPCHQSELYLSPLAPTTDEAPDVPGE
ncbi:glycoside hydrolase family 88 protein [Streptomyces sp. NPDC091287]|uniref:glycoside hydrolase family 88 protein n=1 Tax=Streptomyces sp. NPDC091287 TaxID=3365988 RepID=UPI00380F6B8C